MTRAQMNPAKIEFRISSFCDGGACVGVAKTATGVVVRATAQTSQPTLKFSQSEWVAFVQGVKNGEFDL